MNHELDNPLESLLVDSSPETVVAEVANGWEIVKESTERSHLWYLFMWAKKWIFQSLTT